MGRATIEVAGANVRGIWATPETLNLPITPVVVQAAHSYGGIRALPSGARAVARGMKRADAHAFAFATRATAFSEKARTPSQVESASAPHTLPLLFGRQATFAVDTHGVALASHVDDAAAAVGQLATPRRLFRRAAAGGRANLVVRTFAVTIRKWVAVDQYTAGEVDARRLTELCTRLRATRGDVDGCTLVGLTVASIGTFEVGRAGTTLDGVGTVRLDETAAFVRSTRLRVTAAAIAVDTFVVLRARFDARRAPTLEFELLELGPEQPLAPRGREGQEKTCCSE